MRLLPWQDIVSVQTPSNNCEIAADLYFVVIPVFEVLVFVILDSDVIESLESVFQYRLRDFDDCHRYHLLSPGDKCVMVFQRRIIDTEAIPCNLLSI